jgi:Uma2 family endonuclease
MATIVWNATIDDLYRVEGKAELVDGYVVLMPVRYACHGSAIGSILVNLHAHVRKVGSGSVFGSTTVFRCNLPNRRSFSPDCSYYTGPRAGMDFLPQPPVFAVEVRSTRNDVASERRMTQKRADYFAAGTQVVWDVDLDSNDTIRVYRYDNPEMPTVRRRGETAEAEPAVPGWTFAVDELWA